MKKFQYLLFAFVAVSVSLVMTSCGEDETPIVNDPPSMAFLSTDPTAVNGDYQTTSFETDLVGQTIYVGLDAAKGTGALQSLQVNQDGEKVATDRLSFRDLSDGSEISANNSLLILGTNVDGFQIEVGIVLQDDFSTSTYEFTLTDENGEVSTLSMDITTFDPGTPIEMTLEGILLNQAGPAGTGGLDLDNGDGTGSQDAAAEIRDLGIDCTIDPNNGENWRTLFGTVNGAEMVRVDMTAMEGLTFDGVAVKETIAEAFTTGITLDDGTSFAPDCTETTVTDVSGSVAEGDLFVVSANGLFYMLRVDEINFVHNTINDYNDDGYVFSIKY